MVRKIFFEKNYMFKMCFKTHRIQKIYLKINFFFRPPSKKLPSSTPQIFIVDEKKKVFFKYIFLESMGPKTYFKHKLLFRNVENVSLLTEKKTTFFDIFFWFYGS